MRISSRAQRLLMLVFVLFSVMATAFAAPQPAEAGTTEMRGVLHVAHGDPMPGSGGRSIVRYTLWDAGDHYTELNISDTVLAQAGGEQAVRQREVTVRGATRAGRIDVSSIALEATSLDGPFATDVQASALTGSQRWITILCRFSDIATEPQTPSWFNTLIGGSSTSYPGLNHYWREVSYDKININGSTVAGWYQMAGTRASYFSGQNAKLMELGQDCANAAGGSAAISGYMGVNFMFNADLDCCAWGGSMPLYGTGYKTTWMPVWGWSNQMILAHEMGHGYGLPHSSGPYNQVYDSQWDLMSSGGSCAVAHAEYGCIGVHTNAHFKDMLGWINTSNKVTVTPGAVPATFNLAPLHAPAPADSMHMIRIPIQGSNTQFYVIEARRQVSYDQNVPGNAVILHHINTNNNEIPAKVVDIDNNNNPNDAGAMWIPGETFVDTANNIGVEVNSFNGDTYQVTVRCHTCDAIVDAEVVSVSGPASVAQGQTASISAEVRNNGTASVEVTVNGSTSPAGFVGSQAVALNAGESETVTFDWLTDSETATGEYVFTVTANAPGDNVPGNNAKTLNVTVNAVDGPQTGTVEVAVKCYQIDASGSLTSDRCNNATLHGQSGTTSDGYRYTFSNVPVPSAATLVLFPMNAGPCQAGTLTMQQPNGVQSFGQERSCTTWAGEQQTIQNVPHFGPTWARTDLAVASGLAARTWLWGPQAYSGFRAEPYVEAGGSATPFGQPGFSAFDEPTWSGGFRLVIYLDKTRMEITHPDAVDDGLWYVTNGLLVAELTSGRLQLGDDTFEQRTAANVNVAGDSDDPTGPTYATFGMLRNIAATPDGATIVQRVSRDGSVTTDTAVAVHGVTAAQRVQEPGIDHQVASVFWTYMNSTGMVYRDGEYAVEPLFVNPFYATGLPITEAYWSWVKIGGTYKDVLIQCFERRCLTYTPDNPEGWKVEAGNVGQHYHQWRYGE